MARGREYNPLTYIPSAKVVEDNRRKAEETVRRLKVLLRTARAIERKSGQRNQETCHAS